MGRSSKRGTAVASRSWRTGEQAPAATGCASPVKQFPGPSRHPSALLLSRWDRARATRRQSGTWRSTVRSGSRLRRELVTKRSNSLVRDQTVWGRERDPNELRKAPGILFPGGVSRTSSNAGGWFGIRPTSCLQNGAIVSEEQSSGQRLYSRRCKTPSP